VANLRFTCEKQDCALGLIAENKLLRRLRLSPPTVADAGVGFKNGTASEIYIYFTVSKRNSHRGSLDATGVVVRESADRPWACDTHFDLLLHKRYGVGEVDVANIAMNPCVLPEDRAKALSVNTGCLTKIGGCKKVEDLLPGVFSKH
jgi:hypothetical protein